MPRLPHKATRRRRKGKSKGKRRQTKPTARVVTSNAQAEQEEPEQPQEQDEDQEDDPEAHCVEAQSTSESEMDSDGMLDWSASECKDYKDCITTVTCASPGSVSKLSDTWEWRGLCCLVRVHRQLRRCLFTPTWKEDSWQGLTVQPQRTTYAKFQDQSFLSPVIENVKSVELLRPRKVSYPWTGETHFRVTPAACGNSVFRTAAKILVPVNDMTPMAIAGSGALHVILPQTALFDSKSAKPVNLRLAAGEIMLSKRIERSLLSVSLSHKTH